MAVVASGVLAVFWLLAFVPSAPTTEVWRAFVLPTVPVAVLLLAVSLWDVASRYGASYLRRRGAIPLWGWRRRVAPLLVVVPVVGLVNGVLLGGLRGATEKVDGRYVVNDHGIVTELSREEWLDARAAESQWFSGILVFTASAALYLTQGQKTAEAGRRTRPALRSGGDTIERMDRWRGVAPLVQEVARSPAEVVSRLAHLVPVEVTSRADDGSLLVAAEWDEPIRRMNTPNGVQFEGTITPAPGGRSHVDLVLRPTSLSAKWAPIGAPVALLLFGGAGVQLVLANRTSSGGLAFACVWLGMVVLISYLNVTAGPRVVTKSLERLRAALQEP